MADLKDPAYAEQYVKAALRESRKAFLVALKDVAAARFGMSKLAERVVMNPKVCTAHCPSKAIQE